jgi:hypothetical protein
MIRVVLAVVLAVAATAKFADRPGTRIMLAGFGVPPRLAAAGAAGLPVTELAIAIALVPSATSRVAGVAAILLFATFTAAVATALARGRTPDCNCFGALRSAPIGPWTLVRNVTLTALGVVAVVDPAAGQLSAEGVAIVILAVIVAALAAAQLELLRQHGRLLVRLDSMHGAAPAGLQIGEPAPDFELPDVTGEWFALDALLPGDRPLLLVFTHPECDACDAPLAHFARRASDSPALAFISSGDPGANVTGTRVLLQTGREVAADYGIRAVPGAVLLTADGRIAAPPVEGSEAVIALHDGVTGNGLTDLHIVHTRTGVIA